MAQPLWDLNQIPLQSHCLDCEGEMFTQTVLQKYLSEKYRNNKSHQGVTMRVSDSFPVNKLDEVHFCQGQYHQR